MNREIDPLKRIVDGLVPWLNEKMPGARNITISNIQKPGMGLSNETYLFDISFDRNRERATKELVLRSAPLGSKVFPDYHLSHQFLIMKALRDSQVPVPEMLWLEDDARVIGSPFYIMERIHGTMPKDYPSYHGSGMLFDAAPEARAAVWWNSLDILARIHKIELKKLSLEFLGMPGSGTGPIDRQMAYWERFFAWMKDDPSESYPILEKALLWLRENRHEPERVTLCWGDARIGNILYREPDYKIAAVLDWEMAFLGDPEADLVWFIYIDNYLAAEYGLPRLEGLPSQDETVRRYEELTGWKVKNYTYNEVFAAMRFGMVLNSVIKKLMSLGMQNYGDMMQNNYCTRRLAEILGMPQPGPLPKSDRADIKETRVSIQFRLTGPGGNDWHIVSDKGYATRHEGVIDTPACTVRASARDWDALQTGELNQIEAWKTGRLIIDGDLKVMMQLKDEISRLSREGQV
jgi:aminoglycoside phosphotransferase (APT) family kinase protein/putative sterol carrier protein